MKLKRITLENFKAYKSAKIDFDDINIIVGRNDAGKSTVLHALDLFINQNLHSDASELFFKDESEESIKEAKLECCFEVDNTVMVKLGDEEIETAIQESNLLDRNSCFVLGYKITPQSLSGKGDKFSECYIRCENYDISSQEWSNGKQILEQMKRSDLDKVLKKLNLAVESNGDGRENRAKREVLNQYLVSNGINKTEILLQIKDKSDKDRLSPVIARLPSFKLFSNDKANLTSDKEHSGIIDSEVKEIINKEMKDRLDEIKSEMLNKMREKIDGMSRVYGELFDFLGDDNFKIADGAPSISFKSGGIVDKKGLNIDNRGSGFRRLALLSLHLSSRDNHSNTIYGIEEPETSQNPHNQKGIIDAMMKLFDLGAQIIITTHSPSMAKEFNSAKVEYAVVENDGKKSSVKEFDSYEKMFEEIIKTLGILPLDIIGKKLIVFVEGDAEAILLKIINENLIKDEEIVFISAGGKNMKLHIALNYFPSLKQIALFDKPINDETKKWQDDALQKLKVLYPNNSENDYHIVSTKEDITMFWKLDNEIPCPKQRKGEVTAKIKSLLHQNINLAEDNFNDFDEIKGWFKRFSLWK